jgi:UDP-glucose 4-epimerase
LAILITGGAGYIGSHTAYALLDRGERVVVLDNLSTGQMSLVSDAATFVHGDAGDEQLVKRVVADNDIDAIIHFAGSIVAPESVTDPLLYYRNNTMVSRALMAAAVASGVSRFIFSSTAAVYGAAEDERVDEDSMLIPISPYGRSKLMTEWMLQDVARAHQSFHYVALRYFNVAGADPEGRTGQTSKTATHLIKRACKVALGRLSHLDVLGTDYPTPDGTGVRDYIHVSDLALAHLKALDALNAGQPSGIFNCGYGTGFSVRQVVSAMEHVTGRKLPTVEGPRRPGDAPSIVANPTRIKSTLGWQPKYDNLEIIIRSALDWESRQNS